MASGGFGVVMWTAEDRRRGRVLAERGVAGTVSLAAVLPVAVACCDLAVTVCVTVSVICCSTTLVLAPMLLRGLGVALRDKDSDVIGAVIDFGSASAADSGSCTPRLGRILVDLACPSSRACPLDLTLGLTLAIGSVAGTAKLRC
jgi:hypothetical protein